MMSEILVNIGSGNGLLADGTKLLPETMLLLLSMWDLHESNFAGNTHDINRYDELENYIFRHKLHGMWRIFWSS